VLGETENVTATLLLAGVQGAANTGIGVLGQSTSGTCVKALSEGINAIPFVALGFPGQTAHLQEWQNSSGSALSVVDKSGNLGIGTSSPQHLIQLAGGAYCDGTGSWIAGSSVRWKENIEPVTDAVEIVKLLHPVSYNRKETPGKTTMGFIAEEVGNVLPTVVDWDRNEIGYAEGYDHLAILALAVQAIKQQESTIEHLLERIDKLERMKKNSTA
jgi:hypothetical protein